MNQLTILELYIRASHPTRVFLKQLYKNINNLMIIETITSVRVCFYTKPDSIVLDNIEKINEEIELISKQKDYISINLNDKIKDSINVDMSVYSFNDMLILSKNDIFDYDSAVQNLNDKKCVDLINAIKDSMKLSIKIMDVDSIVKEVISNVKYRFISVYISRSNINDCEINSINELFGKHESTMFNSIQIVNTYNLRNPDVQIVIPVQLYICCVVKSLQNEV